MSIIKFAICHQPRTGSTMLWGVLGHHPQVLCLAELFHQRYHKYPDQIGYHQFKTCYSEHATAKSYLEKILSENVKPEHLAVGFKLQGYQARTHEHPDPLGELTDVRDYIREQGYKIIIPFRRNRMEQYTSQSVAIKTDLWQRFTELPDGTERNDGPADVIKIHVTEDHFRGWYTWDQNYVEKIKRETQGLDTLEVFYEDFLDDWDNQTNRILDFLGVFRMGSLRPKSRKLREQPLHEWIENYDEACEIHDRICTPEEVEYRKSATKKG